MLVHFVKVAYKHGNIEQKRVDIYTHFHKRKSTYGMESQGFSPRYFVCGINPMYLVQGIDKWPKAI